ncbi:MAG: Vegetative incompatibility protein [Marmoricola sp.]|nr:Vegetative incompatibility protein [Marmoricola sp.]
MRRSRAAIVTAGLLAAVSLAGCGSGPATRSASSPVSPSPSSSATSTPAVEGAPAPRVAWPFRNPLPGMPPVIGGNVYSQTRRGMLSPAVAGERSLLYVPDSKGSSVTVIDPRTRHVVKVVPTGYLSQHVVPAYDLRRLLVNASVADELVPLNPRTVTRGRSITVPRPYNLSFTPDGKQAVVMVEQHDTLRFSDPRTFAVRDEVHPAGCRGPNHAEFSANGRFFVVTCEFSGQLVKVDTLTHRVLGEITFDPHRTATGGDGATMGMSMPQDVRLSPDGRTFYVADMGTDELRRVSARTFRQVGVIGMPSHPHGIYPSRDGRLLYVSDRGAGEVSVVDPRANRIVATWTIPGGGSPDMGGVSADGRMLWLAGRYDGEVYGFDTRSGRLVARIPVGGSPHGLAVWPQPGRYSLGHTGNMR